MVGLGRLQAAKEGCFSVGVDCIAPDCIAPDCIVPDNRA
jgi:hypothetical protein